MPAGSTYSTIATTTLGSNQADYTFTSIPSTYTDLVLVINGQVSSSVTTTCQFNGDTGSNYSSTEIFGDGSVASSFRTGLSFIIMGIGAQTVSGFPFMSILNFQNYSNTTTFKTAIGRTSQASLGLNATVGLWRSTSAINSIKVMTYLGASGYTAGTTFTLYGIASA
jgi:hypothetical protein